MIKVGDRIPDVGFKTMGPNGPQSVSAHDLFDGKTVALFSLPGAFTPTCSARHLPGFVEKADSLRAKGIDAIACVAVNDPFVMDAWGKHQNVGDKVMMLADGSGAWTRAVGMELDLTGAGLGVRGERFAMVVKNGVVSWIGLDQGGAFEKSSAETLLTAL